MCRFYAPRSTSRHPPAGGDGPADRTSRALETRRRGDFPGPGEETAPISAGQLPEGGGLQRGGQMPGLPSTAAETAGTAPVEFMTRTFVESV
jgi:hypothetical protein